MSLDMTKNVVKVVVAEKTIAEYTHVGECEMCGVRLFACSTHPARADEMIGNHPVVYVPGGSAEAPQKYCQQHDPNRALKIVKQQVDEYGRPLIMGDAYTPMHMR